MSIIFYCPADVHEVNFVDCRCFGEGCQHCHGQGVIPTIRPKNGVNMTQDKARLVLELLGYDSNSLIGQEENPLAFYANIKRTVEVLDEMGPTICSFDNGNRNGIPCARIVICKNVIYDCLNQLAAICRIAVENSSIICWE